MVAGREAGRSYRFKRTVNWKKGWIRGARGRGWEEGRTGRRQDAVGLEDGRKDSGRRQADRLVTGR